MEKDIFTKNEKEIWRKMDFTSIDDLISHYPFRYEKINLIPYKQWKINEKIAIEGKLISNIKTTRVKKLTITKFDISNEDDLFHITIFNRPWLSNIKLNDNITIIGKYEGNQKITATTYNLRPLIEQLDIQPIYNLKAKITNKAFVKMIEKALDHYITKELIPISIKNKYRLINKAEALRKIHKPKSQADIIAATRYLKYEEFLRFQMVIAYRRMEKVEHDLRYQKKFAVDDVFRMANQLKFKLTNDQLKAVNDIVFDMQSPKPMYRLIQGDVGSGKTVVAALGLYACYLAGKQGAFMAPTEVLAKQQYDEFKKLFKHTTMKIAVLYSALNQTEKNETLQKLASNEIDLIVGTHSLIQDDVSFATLGMIVTDEQHRFGVNQRRKLIDKGSFVDIMIMSATPIPRTLTNVLYGDMDVSNIFTLPIGRKPVITKLIKQNSMIKIIDEILLKVDNGDQVYIVCPAINDNNDTGVRNITAIYQALKKELGDRYHIDMLHGKMDSSTKDKIVASFKAGYTQILVTTTVVEVGINVEAANIMVIYDANRFGLSQLHQLRGRIKRSSKQGYCYLLTSTDDIEALERLNILVESDDGFKIAEADLRLRGPGDIFGIRQSGVPSFILGNLITDTKIIKASKEDAENIVAYPTDENQAIREETKNFLKNNDYID
ncbi:MAG: ATP-dependent DNA helicase RecG [Erysipelotrichaceae bacterium]|nr:ATP-dependent DNA helicase RecG [Erysipelotrichaceae bacterium]